MALFGNEEQQKETQETETIIGTSVKVDGKFSGDGNVLVQGKIAGNMKTKGNINIDNGAMVKADLEAVNIVISGEVHGNIKAIEKLELSKSAKVFGDVEAKTVTIGAGAALNGKCTMQPEGIIPPETVARPNGRRQSTNGNGRSKNNRKTEIPI